MMSRDPEMSNSWPQCV